MPLYVLDVRLGIGYAVRMSYLLQCLIHIGNMPRKTAPNSLSPRFHYSIASYVVIYQVLHGQWNRLIRR